MRFSPYESEFHAIATMVDTQLLEYFMTRVFETDEVWYLVARSLPKQRLLDDRPCLMVWPYKKLATDAALDYWQDSSPASCSLEYFFAKLLEPLSTTQALVEVMPRGEAPGCLIAPNRLQAILQGMLDAGEYRLDG